MHQERRTTTKKNLKSTVVLIIAILLLPTIILSSNIKSEKNEIILIENNKLTADSYYVSTQGSDRTGDGSLINPWRTIQKAASIVSSGENVYIRAGTYNEKVTITKLAGSGSWITFQPYENEKVILDGAGVTGAYDGVILLKDGCNFIRITGLEIKNAAYSGVMLLGGEITDIRIDNCIIHTCQGAGIYAYSGQYDSGKFVKRIEFDHNTVYDVHLAKLAQEAISFSGVIEFEIHHNNLARYGKEGIDVKDGTSKGSIHHNTIDTSSDFGGGQAIYIDGYKRLCRDIDIYSNYITGNGGSGIILNAEHPEYGGAIENINVYNNIICLSQKSGYTNFRSIDSLNDCPWTNVKIYNNICYNGGSKNHVIRIMPSASNIKNLVIANNIFTGNSYNIMYFQHMTFSESQVLGRLTLTNNLYHRFDGNANNQWVDKVNPVGGWGDNPVISDPLFVNKDKGDLYLKSASPAIDAADSRYAPETDYDGKKRPIGAGYDIGAYEFGEDRSIKIIKPVKAIYLSNRQIVPFLVPLIIGPIDIEVGISNDLEITSVEFYIDGVFMAKDYTAPYKWLWNKQTLLKFQKYNHIISVIAYDNAGEIVSQSLTVWKFF